MSEADNGSPRDDNASPRDIDGTDDTSGTVDGSGQSAPQHVPVMLDEIIAALAPALGPATSSPTGAELAGQESTGPGSGGPRWAGPPVLVDCTLGLAGHAEALLQACPDAQLIGLDRDRHALASARRRLAPFEDRVTLVEAVYDELPEVLERLGRPRVQAVLLDLGLSSLQIDDRSRGFAYAVDAPLDMRMSPGAELTAAEVLNTYSAAELARILRRFGEERFADRIARRVVEERSVAPFTTSARLVELLYAAIPAAARQSGGHPAKRTFQALRIEVNDELSALEGVLPAAVAALAVGGRIAVLAYHSLEDRLVKQVLAAGAAVQAPRDLPVVPPELQPELRLLTRGADRPAEAEVAVNPRAASARLRVAERIREATGPGSPRAGAGGAARQGPRRGRSGAQRPGAGGPAAGGSTTARSTGSGSRTGEVRR